MLGDTTSRDGLNLKPRPQVHVLSSCSPVGDTILRNYVVWPEELCRKEWVSEGYTLAPSFFLTLHLANNEVNSPDVISPVLFHHASPGTVCYRPPKL